MTVICPSCHSYDINTNHRGFYRDDCDFICRGCAHVFNSTDTPPDVARETPTEPLALKLKRAFQDRNHELVVIIIEEMINHAIDEHKAEHHADR